MKERENDTTYVSLNEIINNYDPKTQISESLVNKYIGTFGLDEEGDTVITGSFRDWLLFIGFIIDKYEKDNV